MNNTNIIAYIRYTVHRKCPSTGWKIAARVIPDHELVLITNGKGIINIDGTNYHAKKGMLFYFNNKFKHSLTSDNDDPMEFYAMHFSFVKVDYSNGDWIADDTAKYLLPENVMYIKSYIKIKEIFRKINRNMQKNSYDFQRESNYYFIDLYYHILTDIKENNYNYSSAIIVEKTINYINNNLSKRITIKELSNLFRLSSDYYTKLFKEYTGTTPSNYITKAKIDNAKTMMCETDMKIQDIALSLGFCDQFHFSKTFKKIEGIQPSLFMKTKED